MAKIFYFSVLFFLPFFIFGTIKKNSLKENVCLLSKSIHIVKKEEFEYTFNCKEFLMFVDKQPATPMCSDMQLYFKEKSKSDLTFGESWCLACLDSVLLYKKIQKLYPRKKKRANQIFVLSDSIIHYSKKLFGYIFRSMDWNHFSFRLFLFQGNRSVTPFHYIILFNEYKLVKAYLPKFKREIGLNFEKHTFSGRFITKKNDHIFPIEIAIMGKEVLPYLPEILEKHFKEYIYPSSKIVELLLQNGAKINSKYYDHPLKMIRESNRPEHEKRELRRIIKKAMKEQKNSKKNASQNDK